MGPLPTAARRARSPILVVRPTLPPLLEYERHLRRIWRSRILTNQGPYALALERRLSRYLPAADVAVVANGTLALHLALRALGGRGRVVVTTPFTFAATTTSLAWEGYTPRFADIDPETFNLDPESVSDRMDESVAGVLSVHVFGNPGGAKEIAKIGREHHRWVLFDAAHSFGTRVTGRSLYDLGTASTLSFHATKTFHTFEGGAVASPRRVLVERIRTLRNFGLEGSEDVRSPGLNAKMSEAHAAMGVTNLPHIDGWIQRRRRRFELYRDLLAPCGRVTFQRIDARRYNYAYMPILLPSRRSRDRVFRDLEGHGIHPRRYFYPLTSHFTFLHRGNPARCPVAESVANRVLTLPLYPDLPLGQVRRIADRVRKGLVGAAA